MSSVILRGWSTLSPAPLGVGRWVFTKAVCFKAPYFGSMRPEVVELEPGRAAVKVRNRRRVHNHIGTVHAIAMCNAAEMAMGVAVTAAVPPTHRWIPAGMTVKYLARAETDVVATAQVPMESWPPAEATDVEVPVSIRDEHGTEVCAATITVRVGPKPARS